MTLFGPCFVGWSSRGSSDRYNTYSHSQSPLSPTPQDGLPNGLPYSDTTRRPQYQSYRPSNYGISEPSYLDKDFKELSAEDTYTYPKYDSTISKDPLERPRYDSKGSLDRPSKYDPSNDLYQRKYSSYSASRVDDIDGPIEDTNWASPPKSTPTDIPSSLYAPPVRSRTSVTDAPDFIRERKSSTLYEDKYYSDNDAVSGGSKTRSRYGSDLKYMSGDLRQWQRGHLDSYGETNSPSSQVIFFFTCLDLDITYFRNLWQVGEFGFICLQKMK